MALVGSTHSVVFEADGGCVQFTLTNTGMTDLVYKIKSTNNKDYRFKNVYGFVNAGAKLNIEITRTVFVSLCSLTSSEVTSSFQKAAPRNDKFVVQYSPAPQGIKDPQAACKNMTPLGEISIGLHAVQ
ncbi:MSP domain protein [Ancylostoma caninum]|uniref:Major sperm protein n=1 Tax=Ancylostoma caninum TaxID=29170 RepID=A0A368GYS7_ANCCA|nr:MSP domain protein [Ancylostoma caninum]